MNMNRKGVNKNNKSNKNRDKNIHRSQSLCFSIAIATAIVAMMTSIIFATNSSVADDATNTNRGTSTNAVNSSGGEIRNGANTDKTQQTLGTAMNAAAAGMYFSMCAPPENIYPCIIGAITVAQALTTAGAAGKSAGIEGLTSSDLNFGDFNTDPCTLAPTACDLTNLNGGSIGLVDPNQSLPGGGTIGTALSELNTQIEEHSDDLKGLSIDTAAGTVTDTATGKTESFADVAAAAAGSSGFSALQSKISKKLASMKAATDKDQYKVSGVGVAATGGGDSGGDLPGLNLDAYKVDTNFGDIFGKFKKGLRGPSSVKGLTKNLGGIPIGVSGDNIFEMIHRRYQQKRANKIFDEKLLSTIP